MGADLEVLRPACAAAPPTSGSSSQGRKASREMGDFSAKCLFVVTSNTTPSPSECAVGRPALTALPPLLCALSPLGGAQALGFPKDMEEYLVKARATAPILRRRNLSVVVRCCRCCGPCCLLCRRPSAPLKEAERLRRLCPARAATSGEAAVALTEQAQGQHPQGGQGPRGQGDHCPLRGRGRLEGAWWNSRQRRRRHTGTPAAPAGL